MVFLTRVGAAVLFLNALCRGWPSINSETKILHTGTLGQLLLADYTGDSTSDPSTKDKVRTEHLNKHTANAVEDVCFGGG